MNTLENNKLIAEFLGATNNNHPDDYDMYGIIETIEDGEDEKHYFKPEEMLFNSDWNWLMEVVEKIESLDFSFQILKNGWVVINDDDNEEVLESFGESKLNAVYGGCIEFIKYYNEQNS